ncbi:sensor domain-containing diguanylate cyclase [Pseudomonas cremoricolorata]|uniref:Diguanylate cyclase n=1 Tax=Pseudomonas cremoricolorata TaxID=157783 RepID=A0A089WGW0_9PSED|nr:sensor domain-containing diguanylate cyclase [Pseudomonas cremoricolorata]AIR88530.1 hypothetical protein LK03_04355 [Pseudomonas cremoricolorata]
MRWGLPALASGVFFAVAWGLLQRFDEDARHIERVRTGEVAMSFAVSVEKVLERALTANRTLAVMVYQGHGEVPDFTALASFLLPLYKGAYALSLAPQGIIRQIEPLDRNLLVRDHDLLEDLDRAEVLGALDPAETVIQFSGPFELIQGPIGGIGMLPVFLPDAEGTPRFWGYTVVTLMLPEALEDANLPAIEAQGYAYALVGDDAETGEPRVLQRSQAALADELCRDVQVGQTRWKLCVAPLKPWRSQARHYFEIGLTLLGSGLMGWLVYALLSLRQRREELLQQALIDPLTGLANRRLMLQRLTQAQERARRKGTRFALALLDLDGFKGVNDRFGHAHGDEVLINTAQRVLATIRVSDTLARLGGDEFVLIMEDVSGREECQWVLDRIVSAVREPHRFATGTAQVQASVGVVISDGGAASDSDRLLRLADAAMYEAKALGKNRYVFAEDGLLREPLITS